MTALTQDIRELLYIVTNLILNWYRNQMVFYYKAYDYKFKFKNLAAHKHSFYLTRTIEANAKCLVRQQFLMWKGIFDLRILIK